MFRFQFLVATRILLGFALAASLSWAQDKKIVITGTDRHWWAMTDEALAEFKSGAGNATVVVARTGENLAREIADADAVIGGISQDLFPAAKNLRWVQSYSAGVEAYQWPEFIESDVVLTNCKIVQGPPIADHAMTMLLSLTRGMHRYIPNREEQEWNRDPEGLTELQGMTALVIGVGGIGTQIAQRAHAFGMKVIGVDPKDIPPTHFLEGTVRPDRLDEVLPGADVVFMSAPLTPKSTRMMGAEQFELMKRGAYFIAVSRGKTYDTPSLVKALDSQKLAGAGLDVTDPEPLPKGHALWNFKNVIITPHIASQSPGARSRRIALIKENIARFVGGEPLLNVVEKRRGY